MDVKEPEWMTDELKEAVRDATEAFGRAGGLPHPSVIDHYKLALLIDILLDPSQRVVFEFKLAGMLRELAEQAATQMARARLLEGVNTAMPNGNV